MGVLDDYLVITVDMHRRDKFAPRPPR